MVRFRTRPRPRQWRFQNSVFAGSAFVMVAALSMLTNTSVVLGAGLAEECSNESEAFTSTVGQVGSDAAKKHNVHCNHQRMLRQGTTVHVIHADYADKLYEKVKSKPGDFATFKKDGVCSKSDADVNSCIGRLKRASLDARISEREQTIRHNEGVAELLDSSGDKHALAVGQGTRAPNDKEISILRDLRRGTEVDPRKKRAPTLQDLLEVKTIQFGTDPSGQSQATSPASSLADPKKLNLSDTKKMSLEKELNVPADQAKRMELKVIEVGSGTRRTDLDQDLAKLQSKLKTQLAQDQKTFDADQKQLVLQQQQQRQPGGVAQQPPQSNTSYDVFKDVMDKIDSDVKKTPGTGGQGILGLDKAPVINPDVSSMNNEIINSIKDDDLLLQ